MMKTDTQFFPANQANRKGQALRLAVLELDKATGFNFAKVPQLVEQDYRDMRTIALAYGLPMLADRLRA